MQTDINWDAGVLDECAARERRYPGLKTSGHGFIDVILNQRLRLVYLFLTNGEALTQGC